MAGAQQLTSDVARGAAGAAREALYVTVGLGVLGFQRAQVHRVELQRRLGEHQALESGWRGVLQAVSTGRERLEGLAAEAGRAAGSTLGPLEEELPKAAREVAQLAQDGAHQVGEQLRQLVRRR